MNIPEAPNVGWGILTPDEQITDETLQLIEALKALPQGQRDALLTRAVGRYLFCELKLDQDQEPDRSQMVACSQALSNYLFDICGAP